MSIEQLSKQVMRLEGEVTELKQQIKALTDHTLAKVGINPSNVDFPTQVSSMQVGLAYSDEPMS